MHYDAELNGRGLRCPLPLLRTKDLLRTLRTGDVLRVVADDPQALRDFEVFVNQGGHALLGLANEEGALVFYIRRGDANRSASNDENLGVSVRN